VSFTGKIFTVMHGALAAHGPGKDGAAFDVDADHRLITDHSCNMAWRNDSRAIRPELDGWISLSHLIMMRDKNN
jgi:hypothetical protein